MNLRGTIPLNSEASTVACSLSTICKREGTSFTEFFRHVVDNTELFHVKLFKLTHGEELRRTVFPKRSRSNLKFIDISSRKTCGAITSTSIDYVAIAIGVLNCVDGRH